MIQKQTIKTHNSNSAPIMYKAIAMSELLLAGNVRSDDKFGDVSDDVVVNVVDMNGANVVLSSIITIEIISIIISCSKKSLLSCA